MSRAVPDFGPSDARLLIVGEAGGKHEGAKGRPFVGPVGRRVREMITAYGLNHETHVRYANVIPVEMPTLPKAPYAMQAVVRQYWNAIDATLASGSHRAVIAYGRAALWRLTGRNKILDEHGSVYHIEIGGRKVPLVVSIHPAAVMHSKIEAGWMLVESATDRACRYAQRMNFNSSRQLPSYEWDYTGDKLAAIHMQAVMTGAPIAIDTEYDLETKIPFIVGVSVDGEHVVTVAPTAASIEVLRKLLDDANVAKLMHHAPADIMSLSKLGLAVRPPIVDTLMMYATLFPDLPVGLEHMALHLFDHWHSWKTMAHSDPQYNAIDVVATWRGYALMHPMMTEARLWPVWQREVRHVGVLCMAMEARGLAVDPVAQRVAVEANAVAAAKLKDEVNAHVGEVFAKRREPFERKLRVLLLELANTTQPRLKKERNPDTDARVTAFRKERNHCVTVIARWSKGFDLGNNDHLRWLLYDKDGFKLPTQKKDGHVTANADAIARLLGLKRVQESSMMRAVLTNVKEYQHLKKMTNTFLLWDADACAPSAAVDRQGVAHPEYRAFGTGTGRLAGGPDTDLGDRRTNPYAFNALNIPEETRCIYVPHKSTFAVDTDTITTEVSDDDDEDDGLALENLPGL